MLHTSEGKKCLYLFRLATLEGGVKSVVSTLLLVEPHCHINLSLSSVFCCLGVMNHTEGGKRHTLFVQAQSVKKQLCEEFQKRARERSSNPGLLHTHTPGQS